MAEVDGGVTKEPLELPVHDVAGDLGSPPDVTAVPFTEVFHALGMRQPDTPTIGTSTRWRL